MTTVLARLAPGGLVMVATVALVTVPGLRPVMQALDPPYPLAVGLTGLALAWRFGRLRALLALLVVFGAQQTLVHLAPAPTPPATEARTVFVAIATLVPLNLGAIGLLREHSLRRAPLAVGVLGAQVLLVAALTHPDLGGAARWLDGAAVPWLPVAMPRAAALAFLLAAVAVVQRLGRQPTPMHAGLSWALVAAFAALSAGGGGLPATVMLTTGGLVLVVALIETSYRMAYVDELTGLPGRRALNEALADLRGEYAVAMVDIDHFKKFNDEHGHDVGDQLLRMVGARLAQTGGGGRAFRYGGEEFAVLFPGQTVESALPHLEALRKAVESTGFSVRGGKRPRRKPERARRDTGPRRRVSVTVSIGVAGAGTPDAPADGVVQAADAALYRAKRAGRNRVRT